MRPAAHSPFAAPALLTALIIAPARAAEPPAPFAPEPTCNTPAAAEATRAMLPRVPRMLVAHAEAAPDCDGDVGDLLAAWEAAAAGLLPPTGSERERAAFHYGREHSGHELALMLEWRGPIAADDLLQRYEWRAIETTDGGVVLSAVPREREERLFVREFQVMLDCQTRLPTSIRFIDRRGVAKSEPIRLVTFETDRRPVRTAENVKATDSKRSRDAAESARRAGTGGSQSEN